MSDMESSYVSNYYVSVFGGIPKAPKAMDVIAVNNPVWGWQLQPVQSEILAATVRPGRKE